MRKTTTLNNLQKIPETPLSGRVVVQPNTWYICPAGKRAIVKGYVTCTGLGAAAEARFAAATIVTARWTAAGTCVSEGQTTALALNCRFIFDIQLAAGETLVTSQDIGANAEFNMFAKVLELPI